MGNVGSEVVQALPPIANDICVIYCEMWGSIYLINVTPDVLAVVRNTISREWSPKYRVVSKSASIYKLSFSDNPFLRSASAEYSLRAKRLFCRIHADMAARGWNLVNAPNLAIKRCLSSWIFLRGSSPVEGAAGSTDHFTAVSLSSYDRLQFIDFPQELFPEAVSILEKEWGRGVKVHPDVLPNQKELLFNGNPWMCSGQESLDARSSLLCLIRLLDRYNYKLVNSTGLKADTCDCLFFRQTSTPIDTVGENYFFAALKDTNYIALFGVDPGLVEFLADCFRRNWPEGVRDVGSKHGYPVIFLHGHPWGRQFEAEMDTRMLLTVMFQELACKGWQPFESIDCSRSYQDKSTIVFVRTPPTRMHYFCLCPWTYNEVAVINAPVDILAMIREIFARMYTPGLSKEKQYGCAWKMSLRGNPTLGMSTNASICFHHTLLAVILAVKERDWYLLLSGDVTNHTRNDGHGNRESWSVHSLWFARNITE